MRKSASFVAALVAAGSIAGTATATATTAQAVVAANAATPPAVAAAARAAASKQRMKSKIRIIDGRSPDTGDAADAAQLQLADGRSPDTLDAAAGSKPTATVQPGGFHWGDAGLGAIVTAMLLGFAAASLLLLTRFHRHHGVQTR